MVRPTPWSAEAANDGESTLSHLALNRTADFIHGIPHARSRQPRLERCASARLKSFSQYGAGFDENRSRSVGDVPILLDGDIQLDEIASFESSPAWNAMHDFVVHANQHGAGKAVDEGRR